MLLTVQRCSSVPKAASIAVHSAMLPMAIPVHEPSQRCYQEQSWVQEKSLQDAAAVQKCWHSVAHFMYFKAVVAKLQWVFEQVPAFEIEPATGNLSEFAVGIVATLAINHSQFWFH